MAVFQSNLWVSTFVAVRASGLVNRLPHCILKGVSAPPHFERNDAQVVQCDARFSRTTVMSEKSPERRTFSKRNPQQTKGGQREQPIDSSRILAESARKP